ncbi:MAG: hypothetical protein HOV94_42700 [Saccharothrix sp.]|nr:hypothetical protein [Saccharothrix sp.]
MACVLAGTFGCSPAASPPPAPAAHDQGTGSNFLPGNQPPDPEALTGEGKLLSCAVRMPREWHDLIEAGRLPKAHEDEVMLVEAVSADARQVFVKSTSGGHSTLSVISDGRRREITRVPSPQQFYGSSFDGRWLTFGVGYDPGNQHLWTVHAWDSTGAEEPFLIGDNRAAQRSPWFFSHTHDGKVAWVQGTGKADRPHGIHLYDLAARTDHVVAEGPVDGPVFFGDLLLWRELDQRAGTGRFTGVSAVDGTPAVLPPPLRDSSPDWYAAADERTIAWVTRDPKTLYGWRDGWAEPKELAVIERGVELPGISFPELSGDLVAWTAKLTSVTDIRTGGTVRSEQPGFTMSVLGGGFVVSRVGNGGSAAPSVVPVTDLPPLPGC